MYRITPSRLGSLEIVPSLSENMGMVLYSSACNEHSLVQVHDGSSDRVYVSFDDVEEVVVVCIIVACCS